VPKLKQYWHHLFAFSVLFGLALLFFDRANGQEATDLLAVTQSVNPDSLAIGEQATISIELQGGSLNRCLKERAPADIVLVIDISASMKEQQKLSYAVQAASQFVVDVDLSVDRIGIVTFSSEALTLQPLTQNEALLQQSINQLKPSGGTNIQAGLQEANKVLFNRRTDADRFIVLLSDGKDSKKDNILAEATSLRNQFIRIFTISLGQDVDQNLMQQIASAPTDHYYAPQASDLQGIYQTIGGQIAESVATDLVITTTIDKSNLQFDSNDLKPVGNIVGNQISWTWPTLADEERVVFSVRVKAMQAGTFPTAVETNIAYFACGTKPANLISDPGPSLNIIPTLPSITPTPTASPTPSVLPPCEVNPLSNECVETAVCVGPVTLPCTIIGLPWWVCILLLLMSTLALLFWSQAKRQQKPRVRPSVKEIVPPNLPSFPPIAFSPVEELPNPLHLTPTPLPVFNVPNATLVIGLGNMGQGVITDILDSMNKGSSRIPALLRLLHVSVANTPDVQHHENSISIPLSQEAHDLVRQIIAEPEKWPHIASWLLPLGNDQGERSRSMHRLALFMWRRSIQQRIAEEIRHFQLGAGQRVELFFISAMAEPVGSGMLVDLAHMARLEAQKLGLKPAIYSILSLPETHIADLNFHEQDTMRRNAFAHWRELNRFQLAFAYDYPFDYGNEYTVRNGRLFERCYLVGPERDKGTSLANTPLAEGLYPAIADFLQAILDPAIRRDWEELHRAVDTRLQEKQTERGQVMYNSLGNFTYILPATELARQASLDLLEQLIIAQQVEPDFDPAELVYQHLKDPGDEELPTTPLMETLARLSEIEADEVPLAVDDWRMQLGELLAPDKAARESWEEMKPITYGELVNAIATGPEAGQSDEYKYHTIFLVLIKLAQFGHAVEIFDELEIIATKLGLVGGGELQEAKINQFSDWLKGTYNVQLAIFSRRMEERLYQLLDFVPDRARSTGLNPARTFLSELAESLTRVGNGVRQVSQKRQAAHQEFENKCKSLVERMAEVREAGQHRRLSLHMALAIGLGIPLMIVLSIGIGFLLFPTLPASIALIPVGFVLSGIYWTFRSLFIPSKLTKLQREYRELVQEGVQLKVQEDLYKSLNDMLVEMHGKTLAAKQPLDEWQESLSTIKNGLEAEHEKLRILRLARKKIRTRRYLEDKAINQKRLHRLIPADAIEDALKRIDWQKKEDESWQPFIYAQQTWQPNPADANAVAAALRSITDSYASAIHKAQLSDFLPDYETPDSLAVEIESVSTPYIRTEPSLQTDQESHRFVSVQAGAHADYFRAVINVLQEPVAMYYTQQAILQASHPHYCYILSSQDLLNVGGLFSWLATQDASYESHMAARHIFPAEVNAARWQKVAKQREPFSPYGTLALENAFRSYIFWVAYAFQWLREDEDLSQRMRSRAWVLDAPQGQPLRLTKPQSGAPSLWEAVVRYGLLKDDSPTSIWQEIEAQLTSTPDERRRLLRKLEQSQDRIQKQGQQFSPADPGTVALELGRQALLVLTDLIYMLDNEPPILAGILRPKRSS
jgi:uncharacterized protein YegL